MSDIGDENNGRHSRNGSMSGRSDDNGRIVTYKSRSNQMSKSPSRSPAKMKYRSRSRSRSHHRSRRSRSPRRSRSRSAHKYKSRYSRSASYRSRSQSYSPYRGSSRRRRHTGTRENPKPSKCLGVFGLSIYTTEGHLHGIFSKFGSVNKVVVVIDAKTGRSRGFSFVYFDSIEDAKKAKETCSGMEIDGRKIRVDYSITLRAHTPTPGIYMGKPTYSYTYSFSDGGRWRGGDDDYYNGGGGGRRGGYNNYRSYDSRRSPSPYYSSRDKRRRYERSRSRSYSPRRYY